MSAITYYTSYERLKLGRQTLEECSAKQSFNTFKLDIDDENEKLKSLNIRYVWLEKLHNTILYKEKLV